MNFRQKLYIIGTDYFHVSSFLIENVHLPSSVFQTTSDILENKMANPWGAEKHTCSNRKILINHVKWISDELACTHGHLLQQNSVLLELLVKSAQFWKKCINKFITAKVLTHRPCTPYYGNTINTVSVIVSHSLL